MASGRPITNDKLYDALTTIRQENNATRLEIKGDIRDLRNQFDQLETGRISRLESKMGDFEVAQTKRDAQMSQNQAVLSTKFLIIWSMVGAVFVATATTVTTRIIMGKNT